MVKKNSFKQLYLIIITIYLINVAPSRGDICCAYGVICINGTSLQQCVDSTPMGDIYTCISGLCCDEVDMCKEMSTCPVTITPCTELTTIVSAKSTRHTHITPDTTGATAGDIEAATGDIEAATGDIEAATGDTEAATGDTEAATGDTEAATGDTEAATETTEAATETTEAATETTEAATETTEAATETTEAATETTEAATETTEAATETTEATTETTEATTEDTEGSTEASKFTFKTVEFTMKTTEFTIETTEFTIETTEATTETTQVITETTEAITETTEATTENTQASTETTHVITETTEATTETTEATTETTFASNEITDLTSETTESTTETANVATDVVERTSKITYIKSKTSLTTASTEISYLCTSTGRFADKTNCSNYYICSSNPSGAYYTYLYTCPSGSLYDQDTDKCSTSPNVTCGPRCNIYGFYCLSNSTLQLCGNVDEAPSGDIYECYAGNYCSMDCFTQCSETIPCISTTTTIFQTTKQTTTSDLSSTTPEPYQCTATGKFADTNNCSKYYVCSSRSSGGFYMYNFTCPSGSLFDRDNGLCTLNASVVCGPRCNDYGFYCLTNTTLQLCADKDVAASGDVYTCYDGNYCSMDCSLMCSETVPCTSSTSTTEFTTTTTISTLTNTQTSFECIASGRFGDPVNCTEYYSCVAKSSGGFYQSQYSCPSGSKFNSRTVTCTYSDSTNTPLTFQCSENGRFEDTSNSSNYILCISQSSGGFYQITYSCPSGSLFDPGTGKCTYSLARCSSTSTTNKEIVSTVTITVVVIVLSLALSLDTFSCTSSGRFADSSSNYNFYVCSSNPSGGYYIYSCTCPNGSVYNNTTQTCSKPNTC